MRSASLRTGRLLATGACAVLLVACGGSDDGADVAGPAASAAAGASTAATPDAPAVPSAQVCPLTATKVATPAGSTTDLEVKPVVKGSTAPPPAVLQYADIVVGTGPVAETGSQAAVKYLGVFYETGKEFDSSWKTSAEQTLPFTICGTDVVPGFAVGPTGMKVGGRRQITIPSELAYGAAGQGDIPANATLVFVVDLVSVS